MCRWGDVEQAWTTLHVIQFSWAVISLISMPALPESVWGRVGSSSRSSGWEMRHWTQLQGQFSQVKLNHRWEASHRSWGTSSALGKSAHQRRCARGFPDVWHEDSVTCPGSAGRISCAEMVKRAESADGRWSRGMPTPTWWDCNWCRSFYSDRLPRGLHYPGLGNLLGVWDLVWPRLSCC